EGPFRNHPDIFAGITVHLLMLATMCPDIVFARLPVILTCGIVTALLGFILIKIEFHSHPLSVGSHAKKGIGYPMRVLISIVPSYTTKFSEHVKKVPNPSNGNHLYQTVPWGKPMDLQMDYYLVTHGSLIFIEVFKIYKLLNLLK